VRDARVNEFRIADSPNFRLDFSDDGSLLRINPNNGAIQESNWHLSGSGTRSILIIGERPYEYRFSFFGRRLILVKTGANIPHMTPQRDLEITFRR